MQDFFRIWAFAALVGCKGVLEEESLAKAESEVHDIVAYMSDPDFKELLALLHN